MKNKKKKKNKKFGFTLVELLAVIVILAIILVIAVPKITDTIVSSKTTSLESSTKLVASSIENDYQSAQTLDSTFSISGSCASYVDSNEYSDCTYEIKNDIANVKLTGSSTGKFANMKSFGTKINVGTVEIPKVEGNSTNDNSLTMVQGDVFIDDYYTYHYKQEYTYNSTTKVFEWTNIDTDGWGVTLTDKTITEVNADPYSKINGKPIVSTAGMFVDATNLKKIKLDNFDTSNVVNMFSMFRKCNSLTSLDLSNLNTSNVTNMWCMFYDCKSLTSLDVSNFDTSNVTTMNAMFCECSSLTSLDLSNFDTSKVTTMKQIFCSIQYSEPMKLINIYGLENWDTSNVTNMLAMFQYCFDLKNLDISNFDTSKVTTMYAMFLGCGSLTSLDVSSFETSNVTNMRAMFNSCSLLTSLDVSNFDTSNVVNMQTMFAYCDLLTDLDLSKFDTSKVTTMLAMFYNDKSLTNLDLSNFDTSSVTIMKAMFENCTSLRTLNLTNKFNMNAVTNSNTMFYNDYNLVISVSNTTLQTKLNSLSTTDKPSTVTVQLV